MLTRQNLFSMLGVLCFSLAGCSYLQREKEQDFDQICTDMLERFENVLAQGATSKKVWIDFLRPGVGATVNGTGRSQRERFLAGWESGDPYEVVHALCYPNRPSDKLTVIISTPHLGNIYFIFSVNPDGTLYLSDMLVASELLL